MSTYGRRRRKRFGVVDDIASLVTVLGGNSKVLGLYDARKGITLSVGKVSQWDDARGASGFGPALVGNGTPLPAINTVPTRVTTDGLNNGLYSTASFNAGLAYSIIYVGTLPSGYSPSPAISIYDSVANTYNGFKDDTGIISAADISLGSAQSATPRLALLSHSTPSLYGTDEPVLAETAAWVQGRIGTQNKIMGARNEASRLSKLYVGGLNPDFARFSAVNSQAIIIVDHQLTGTEWAAIKAWATANHTWTSDDTVAKCIFFDGNSLTFGRFATAGNDYPSRVMAQAAFAGVDWINLGISGRNGGVQNSSFARRVAPFLSGNHTKKIYACFEIGNDITQHGLTGAQSAQNVIDMCVAAKAAGATACIAVTAPPRGDITGAAETARLAANTILRGLPTGIDVVADAASNVNMQTTTNLTYFNADGIHYTDAGYNEIANNATYGVSVKATPYL